MNSTSRGDAGGASTGPGGGAAAGAAGFEGKSYFETQREAMCHEIGLSLETVLQNMNKLNRALEGVIAVGNEFASVEALWSQFETVMGQGNGSGGGGGAVDPNEEEQDQEDEEDERDEEREGEEEADVD